MRKVVSLILIIILSLVVFTGCTKNTESITPPVETSENKVQPEQNMTTSEKKVDYPTKPIKIIVSASAGGGTDIGYRLVSPYLEKELGVPVVIENIGGGGGWVAWTQLGNSKPDGYTIGNLALPHLPAGYLNPNMNREVTQDSFDLIANLVTDSAALAIRKDESRFTNLEELIEYAKNNDVTAIATGVGGDDHIALLKLNNACNINLIPVQAKSNPEGMASFLGAHVDVIFANVGEVSNHHKDNELKVITVLSKERSAFLPDVPTLEEAGYKGVYNGASRGIAAPTGLDPDVYEILCAAFEKVNQNEEYIQKMKDSGLEIDYAPRDEYKEMFTYEENEILKIKELLGF